MGNLRFGMKAVAGIAGALCMAGIGWHSFAVQAQGATRQYTLNDAYGVLECALKVPDATKEPWHDMDGDGDVTLDDARLCLQYALKVRQPDGANTPTPSPTKPGGDIGGNGTQPPTDTSTPLPTGSPSGTAQPGDTSKPTDPPEGSDATPAPYISTDHITLYTGNDATGNACATVTLYNTGITSVEEADEVGPGFDYEETLWLDQGKESSFWMQFSEKLFKSHAPVVSGNAITYTLEVLDEYKDNLSGAGTMGFFLPDDTYFEVDVAIERNHTDITYYRIMEQYYMNIGTVSENATFSDPSMCTTDAAVIIDGLNNIYGTYKKWNIPQDGSMYVTGPCVITELEVDTERHYTVNHEKRVEEIYLEPKGEYDEEMTRAVEAEMKKDGGWYTGDEANCPHPKAYIDFVYNTLDSWYNGRISYRCMLYTLRYTKFYEGNTCTNGADILEGARPEYFPISDTNGTVSGQGQNCHIFTIKGTIDVNTVWQAMEDQSYGMGLNSANTGYVRVHYDPEYDISYIYYIG